MLKSGLFIQTDCSPNSTIWIDTWSAAVSQVNVILSLPKLHLHLIGWHTWSAILLIQCLRAGRLHLLVKVTPPFFFFKFAISILERKAKYFILKLGTMVIFHELCMKSIKITSCNLTYIYKRDPLCLLSGVVIRPELKPIFGLWTNGRWPWFWYYLH